VGFELWLERDHVMLLDFDPVVVGLVFAAVLVVLARWWSPPQTRTGLFRSPG
jgi:hypothetical protein